jgi:hypothetical protein
MTNFFLFLKEKVLLILHGVDFLLIESAMEVCTHELNAEIRCLWRHDETVRYHEVCTFINNDGS